jgi:hypothetical protein
VSGFNIEPDVNLKIKDFEISFISEDSDIKVIYTYNSIRLGCEIRVRFNLASYYNEDVPPMQIELNYKNYKK